MKQIKKEDVLNLVVGGVKSITVHTLSVEHSYKIYKFKKAIKAAFEALQNDEKVIIETLGIEDEQALYKRIGELNDIELRSDDEQKELDEKNTLRTKLGEMRKKLYEEKISLEGVKALPYAEWKKLQDENASVATNIYGRQAKVDVFTGYNEELLEDILWLAPEDEK